MFSSKYISHLVLGDSSSSSRLHILVLATILLAMACCATVARAEEERAIEEHFAGAERFPVEEDDDVQLLDVDNEGEEGADGEAWLEGEEVDDEPLEEGKRARFFTGGKRGSKNSNRMFVGKRARVYKGKRFTPMFVGKRGRMFHGKRRILLRPVSHVEKRSPAQPTNEQLSDIVHTAGDAAIVKRATNTKQVKDTNLRPM